jgi:hypothetical protein
MSNIDVTSATLGDYMEILGRQLKVSGKTKQGYGRGSKTLGFPTANLPYFDRYIEKLDWRLGVYFGWATVGWDAAEDKIIYPVVCNLGFAPTFGEEQNKMRIIESHLLDYPPEKGDFYNETLRVALVAYLRPEQTFDGVDALKAQIAQDCEIAKKAAALAEVDKDCPLAQAKSAVNEFLVTNCLHGPFWDDRWPYQIKDLSKIDVSEELRYPQNKYDNIE